jgi:hypothetical protein
MMEAEGRGVSEMHCVCTFEKRTDEWREAVGGNVALLRYI